MRILLAAVATIVAMVASPALAASTVFAGEGTVTGRQGNLTPSGSAPIGSAFSFSFAFDLGAASLLEQDDQAAFYDLPVTNFSAKIGGYDFKLSREVGFEPALLVGRGFTFFGGNATEPSLGVTFYFASERTGPTPGVEPFVVSPGVYGQLEITALFRADPNATGLGVDQVIDPASTTIRSFAFSTRDPSVRRFGVLTGGYSGGFQTAAGVPEPASWMVLILGFGLVGAVMRRLPRNRSAPALA